MTEKQQEALFDLVRYGSTIKGTFEEFHHGDCIGADEQSHELMQEYVSQIIIHPPINGSKRAFCKKSDWGDPKILDPKEYIARNHDIVNAVDLMIATPAEFDEQLRSGTWATIRYAKKIKRDLVIIYPDGSKEERIINKPQLGLPI